MSIIMATTGEMTWVEKDAQVDITRRVTVETIREAATTLASVPIETDIKAKTEVATTTIGSPTTTTRTSMRVGAPQLNSMSIRTSTANRWESRASVGA